MEEKLDLIDDKGVYLGKSKKRTLIHKDGDWHRSVHVWIINDKKELLIQKRSSNREVSNNCWTISASGHIKENITSIKAAIEEVKEEIGLELNENDLKFLCEYKKSKTYSQENIIDNEFNPIFVVKKSLILNDFKADLNEVSEIKFIKILDLKNKILTNEIKFKPDKPEYHKLLFHYFNSLI